MKWLEADGRVGGSAWRSDNAAGLQQRCLIEKPAANSFPCTAKTGAKALGGRPKLVSGAYPFCSIPR
jgi:hypothetical protein